MSENTETMDRILRGIYTKYEDVSPTYTGASGKENRFVLKIGHRDDFDFEDEMSELQELLEDKYNANLERVINKNNSGLSFEISLQN